LLVKTLTKVTMVPSEAIQHNGPIAFVYAIVDDVAQMRIVKTGVIESGRTVVEGIAPGTVVAVSSFERLQDKTMVIVSAKPVSATAPESTTP
jgi:multidrug efflux system membrane fusion protein